MIYYYKYKVHPTVYAYIIADVDYFCNPTSQLSNRNYLMQILLQNGKCVKARNTLKFKGLSTLKQNGHYTSIGPLDLRQLYCGWLFLAI